LSHNPRSYEELSSLVDLRLRSKFRLMLLATSAILERVCSFRFIFVSSLAHRLISTFSFEQVRTHTTNVRVPITKRRAWSNGDKFKPYIYMHMYILNYTNTFIIYIYIYSSSNFTSRSISGLALMEGAGVGGSGNSGGGKGGSSLNSNL
jgi:hypothetical protein